MTNPVAPPPGGAVPPPPPADGVVPTAPEGSVPPPPATEGFGDAPRPPATEGLGDAPQNAPAEPEKKKKGFGGTAGKVAAAIAVAVVIGLVKFGAFAAIKEVFFADKAKNAAVGDCIKADEEVKTDEETNTGASVVDCASAEAAYSVVGRIEGVTDTKSTACDKFFKEGEEFAVYASDAKGGYLLCLKPKA